MKVLSLFDGVSCTRVALDRLGYKDVTYYASEVDKYAIQIAQKNWPDTVQVGSVVGLDGTQFKDIDLMIGGSPCQDLSIAKANRKGLDGARSGLFWEYVRILNEVKPKYFVLENVNSMPKEAKDLITKTLGVEPLRIDAALVSAQRRVRLFWTNIPGVTLPEDRGILLKDILEDGDGIALTERRTEEAKKLRSEHMKKTGKDFSPRRAKELVARDDGKANCITTGVTKEMLVMKEKSNTIRTGGRGSGAGDKHCWDSVYQYRRTYWRETKGGKVPTLTANMGTGGNNVPYVGIQPEIRKLSILECTRLQSLPDHYLAMPEVSNTQKYKALGNAFNVEVVRHILSFITPKE